jgi:hypothetical protein
MTIRDGYRNIAGLARSHLKRVVANPWDGAAE